MNDINLIFSFTAGLLSFLSPCSLPLYPAFVSYITGVSLQDLKESNRISKHAVLHTLFFLAGFSIIFLVLGLSSSLFSQLFMQYKDLFRQVGAVVIVFFGLLVTGNLSIKFLMKDKRVRFTKRPSGYFGSVLIGLGFAAGWTPCTGPILAAVMALGITNPGSGLIYMSFYILGFAIPFFALTFFVEKIQWFKVHSGIFMNIGGYLMIIMGIFLYFDWMTKIISFLTNNIFGGFTGF
ncbi:MAG: cytochrome c biogenesis CcdA family protein [Bacillota bacterium]|jgi:cytochrome c-type biogenesis protein|uniref:cytochrome c biogenesis CcdA family protein n=1 Tax=Fictibacillus TaxID=1329200 RepID=UPI0018CD554D|nr:MULTISPECIES: cytochrome c biogenesis protein CcdA [unclassified Fictibacillus]MBH0157168.1 sulfite exporter TauE/SafE family protein [Fictibacillus sp. 5RED26]MBH0159489.1 sulfite exporter TauE/SafE family protein [Fictibacillus sp. 26RED30]MBH0163712.1 sulfite exporter TauE/SafE family protein [Fictibacillus sp. 7GRE50]MBH0169662.1 sulfite exporter TauE/SafE family protein [Fictibacillus sp. 18YEL24]MBH0174162.1 sulfite exporter TauE/SafE family protein [Fictibacillus sp. 23RED33]